jgi:hypothetical protein
MKKILSIAVIFIIVFSTFSILTPQLKAEPQEDQGTVYDYEIVSVTLTGPNEVTVKLQVRYCPACNPNDASNPGCPEFTHGYPPPYYPYQYWCGGMIDGRYIAVRIKDETGAILGTHKLVCNPTNWPLNIILTRDFVFSGVPLVAGSTVTAEADVYCSWCGHWYPTPVSLKIAPLKVCIDPGHAPTDVFPKNLEYAINKGVADKLKYKLETHGISVYFTNPDDAPGGRATFTNNLKPDIFVSLHCNALEGFDTEGNPIGTANGREVWIYDDTDPSQQVINELDLAKRTLDGLTKKTGSVFFYPTGKPSPYGYAGWLAGGPGYPPYISGYYHLGQDEEANEGDRVYAIADGVVVYISTSGWGDGNVGIVLRHKLNDGTEFLALYGHVRSNVRINDKIRGGSAFATIGPYDPPHLHFGIRPGVTMPPTNWGRMPLSAWPNTNGFVDPMEWITTKAPAPNEPRKPVPKEKQDPWPNGIPILRGVTVCPAVLHEMEFYDYFGAVSYKGVTYQNMLGLMNTDIWREDAARGIVDGIIGYFEGRGLTYIAKSPVDIVITDPDGLRISKQFNEIPGATYTEVDLDGDGDLDDLVRIPDRKLGDYLITVVPEPGALPTDTYTLEVSLFGEVVTIAENVQISDIPVQPYVIVSTATGIIPPTIRYYLDVLVDPATLPPIPGADWYDECTWVELTAPTYLPSEEGEDGVRYKFSYWDVDGTSQGIGVNPINIHIDAPHIATAYYTAQYYLTVKTDPESIATIPGEGWYDPCTVVTLTAPLEPNVQHLFAYWTVDTAPEPLFKNSIEVHITDGPKTATAIYKDYLGDAKEEINCLRAYVTRLYNDKKIGRSEYNHFMRDLDKVEKDIDKAIKNLDKERVGYDDKMKGFEDLRHAVMKLKHMIKDVKDWAKRGRIPAADAEWIISELEAIRMKLVDKARAEALAERALALKAIEDAKSKGKDTTKAEAEIAKVDRELAKAEQKIAQGKLSQAIQHFKHAFAHSHHAIKKAYDPTWGIDYKDWIDELEEEDP